MCKKIVIFGAGNYGKNALKVLGKENVAFFLDNNPKLRGENIEGIEIKNFDEEKMNLEAYDIIVSVSDKYYGEIEKTLLKAQYYDYYSVDHYLHKKKYCTCDWGKYKNSFCGKRCFLLGTGPSLLVSDLEKLQKNNEICFGANKIFKIFDQTTWRPDIYCATDRRILSFYQKEISELSLPDMFVAYYSEPKLQNLMDQLKSNPNVNLITMKNSFDENVIEFSNNPSKYIIEGRTVMYAMIQLAAYMGFGEIYLLGVDFNYNDATGYDKQGTDHFCKDYVAKGEEVLISSREYCLKAFLKAEEYSRNHGFRIYNATRGGKLEVFERVDINNII